LKISKAERRTVMFRPMRRVRQQLSEDEALEVLKNAKRGVLSVIGESASAMRIASAALIVAGIVGLKLAR
jgi:hypothetical protein